VRRSKAAKLAREADPVNAETPDSPSAGGETAVSPRETAFERIWVALLEHPWNSLAVVPAVTGLAARGVAQGLARAGSDYLGQPLRVLNAEGARLGESRRLLESMAGGERHRTIISIDCPADSEAALLLARQTDGTLLLVPLGRAQLSEVRKLVDEIGRDRIVGAVAVEGRRR
jgi:hypothetical protein